MSKQIGDGFVTNHDHDQSPSSGASVTGSENTRFHMFE